MELTAEDRALIEKAAALVEERKINGGVVGEVGAALRTNEGLVFDGISLALWCDIGFCAEHSAVANMLGHCRETRIDAIVAIGVDDVGAIRVLWPCGRCRQLLEWIDNRNLDNTYVIISKSEKVPLIDLLPQPLSGSK
jgi:cytidine deaminase